MNQPVVVGFDDTEHSTKAVECAAREATARRTSLRVVHAFHVTPMPAAAMPLAVPYDDSMLEAICEASVALVDREAARVLAGHPDLVVEAVSVQDDPAQALAQAGRGADLLVVGGRGRGGFTGLMLGSVALRVLSHAECPVMVVRGDPAPVTGRVMVGVDLDDPAGAAWSLEYAFAEAELRKAEVYAVNAWDDPPGQYWVGFPYLHDVFATLAHDRRQLLDAALDPWRQKYPEVRVTGQVLPGAPSRMLVDSTRLVDLVVIGGRARSEGHAGMQVGALAHTVLHYAHCPVVVVPEH